MSLHPPPAGKAYRWADAPPEVAMKISEVMSIEDLVAIVFDEDDEYSWSSKSEARNAIIRKFNAAQQPLALDVAESPRKCTTEKLCPVHNVWHAAPPRK